MTREMNKPDWHNKWKNKIYLDSSCDALIYAIQSWEFIKEEKPKQRILDEDWKPFIDATNERLK